MNGATVDTAAELDALAAEAEAAELPPAEPAPAVDATAPALATRDALVMVVGPAFTLLAPSWAITADETEAIAGAWAPVMDKYLPGALESFGIELNAALITLAILGPRLGRPRRKAPAPGDGERQAPPGGAPSTPPLVPEGAEPAAE